MLKDGSTKEIGRITAGCFVCHTMQLTVHMEAANSAIEKAYLVNAFSPTSLLRTTKISNTKVMYGVQ
jgi:hypothetical protein